MGAIGVVINRALRYRGYKVTHIKFDAKDHTVHVGEKVILGISSIKEITANNGSISIVDTHQLNSSSHHSAVKVHLKDIGLEFTVKLEGNHLDMWWHSPVKQIDSHGLIGEYRSHPSSMDLCVIL